MTLDCFMTYHRENLREITTSYNKGDVLMDDVLPRTQKTLYIDMSTYVKVYVYTPPTSPKKVAAETGVMQMCMEMDYTKCEY